MVAVQERTRTGTITSLHPPEASVVFPKREFSISPKTSYQDLATGGLRNDRVKRQIADDMITNVKELVGDTNGLDIVLSRAAVAQRGILYEHRGRDALADNTGPTMGLIAVEMKWHMHAPEMVYVSGQYFLSAAKKELAALNKRVKETREGKRRFESEDAKQATYQQEQARAAQVYSFARQVSDSSEKYAQQNLPANHAYLRILTKLLRLDFAKMSLNARRFLFDLLKKREFDQALTAIETGQLETRSPSALRSILSAD